MPCSRCPSGRRTPGGWPGRRCRSRRRARPGRSGCRCSALFSGRSRWSIRSSPHVAGLWVAKLHVLVRPRRARRAVAGEALRPASRSAGRRSPSARTGRRLRAAAVRPCQLLGEDGDERPTSGVVHGATASASRRRCTSCGRTARRRLAAALGLARGGEDRTRGDEHCLTSVPPCWGMGGRSAAASPQGGQRPCMHGDRGRS